VGDLAAGCRSWRARLLGRWWARGTSNGSVANPIGGRIVTVRRHRSADRAARRTWSGRHGTHWYRRGTG